MDITSSRWRSRRRYHPHLLDGRGAAGLALIGLILVGIATPVTATDGVPIVALGESNTETQRAQVMDYLGATEGDQVVTVSVAETLQSMDGLFNLAGVDSAYSSTAVSCLDEGAGIDVLTRNIQEIPPELYALTLLTAGMTDVRLAVAAPDDAPALGMTALTGVFKTWDMEPCSDFGGNPERRRLALEELALIAGIGQQSDTVRDTTLVVLEAQREVIAGRTTADTLDATVESEADSAGLDLSAADQTAIVDFLARLERADIDWGHFTSGWSTENAPDGSGVVLVANTVFPSPEPGLVRAVPVDVDEPDEQAGIGGRTGPIEVAPTPTPEIAPTEPPLPTLPAVSTPVAGDNDDAGIMGTVSENGRDGLARWWPVALGPGLLALLVIGARRQPSEKPTTWFVSRGRMLWLGRTVRRPAVVHASGRPRRVRMTREST